MYREQTRLLGQSLVRKNIEVVFGGGKVGLMGVLADAVLEAGGVVTGVIPGFLDVKEVAHYGVTKMIRVATMHERKALIDDMSDGAIALPGGFGTLGRVERHEEPARKSLWFVRGVSWDCIRNRWVY